MKTANKLSCRYVAIIGNEEFNKSLVTLKSMSSGREKVVSFDSLTLRQDNPEIKGKNKSKAYAKYALQSNTLTLLDLNPDVDGINRWPGEKYKI